MGWKGVGFHWCNTASVSKQILNLEQYDESLVLISNKTSLGLSSVHFCNFYSGLKKILKSLGLSVYCLCFFEAHWAFLTLITL